MNMEKCTSSQIAEYGYDPETKVLAVRFVMGGFYHYRNVPPDVFTEMKAAQSVGRFLHTNVKGRFPFEAKR